MDINNVLIIGYSYCRHIRDAAARPSTSKFCTSAAGRVQTRHVTVPIQPRLRYSTQQKSMLLLRRVLLKPPAQFRKAMATNEINKNGDILKWARPSGEFVRKPATFRDSVSQEGAFKPERDRYHLYVSYACPWAHRTLIVRKLKGLEDVITVDVVDYMMGEKGWRFNPEVDGSTVDSVHGFSHIREVYFKVEPDYSGRFTVPVLFDKKTGRIVNNESSEIIRMLNLGFNAICKHPKLDLYPENLRAEIDALNEWIYKDINNGVYRSGFATKQEPYDKAVREVFNALDRVEEILSRQRYLTGAQLTEADIRLFTTLVRFDKVYVGHFKCNKKRIADYPNLWGYLRDLYQTPGFGETTNFFHIEHHYQESHVSINPHGIVAIGPDLDFSLPHDRATRFSARGIHNEQLAIIRITSSTHSDTQKLAHLE